MNFTLQQFIEDCIKSIKPAFFISITFLSQSLIISTDVIVLGWLGIDTLAAAGYGVRIYMPLFLLCLGVSLCINVMAGQAMGAKQHDAVRLIVRKLLLMGFVFGCVATVILIASIRPLMFALGSTESLIALAEQYVYFFAFVLPFSVLTVGIRNFMTVVGRSAPFMYVSFGMVALNGYLDYGLAHGVWGLPQMGLRGIALSSVVVNVVNTVILIIICNRMQPYKQYRIFSRLEKLSCNGVVNILKIAMPLSSKMVLEALFYAVSFFLVGTFGSAYLAGYQIVYQVDTNIFLFGIGTATAIATRVAYFTGAKDIQGLQLSVYSGIFILALWSIIAGIGAYVFGDAIASFLIQGEGQGIDITHNTIIHMLFILMFYQVFHGVSLGMGAALDGLGETGIPLKSFGVNIMGVGIPLSVILSYYTPLGVYGVLWATGISMLTNTICLIYLWRKKMNEILNA